MMSNDSSSPYPPTTWRLIKTGAAPGPWNMAVDEAILEAVGRGQVPPTLRLYAWDPPCLSLGYSQPFTDVDRSQIQRFEWDIVRRPTGGRAILHTDELTYSVIGPQTEPRLAGNVLESYRVLAGALLEALHRLEIPAQAQENHILPPGLDSKGPVCFEVPSNYEITVAGKKLIGSAQARRKEGVLQHGSLPLFGNLERITWALPFPDETKRQVAIERLHARATTVEEILGRPLEWELAAQAFVQAFSARLNLQFGSSELTGAELARAGELVHEKYSRASWTERV